MKEPVLEITNGPVNYASRHTVEALHPRGLCEQIAAGRLMHGDNYPRPVHSHFGPFCTIDAVPKPATLITTKKMCHSKL